MIEIEKKYDFSKHDYDIIKDKCTFIISKNIIDKFYDTKDFLLTNNRIKLRNRNGKLELKIKKSKTNSKFYKSIEITNENEIKKELEKLGTNLKETKQTLEIITELEKFHFKYNSFLFIIDFQKYKYGYRYEIELELEDDIDKNPDKIINDFRNYLGLNSKEQKLMQTKYTICAKNENKELYKIIVNAKGL